MSGEDRSARPSATRLFSPPDKCFGARGKSGGARIIYLYGGEDLPVFVLAAFAKNEKANLSPAERNALGKLVGDLIKNYRRRK